MYDSHSREHSLRCQIGQVNSKIRKCEASGNQDGLAAATIYKNMLESELRKMVPQVERHTIQVVLTKAQAQALIEAVDEIVEVWEDLDHDDLEDGKSTDAEIDQMLDEYLEQSKHARQGRKILMEAMEAIQ